MDKALSPDEAFVRWNARQLLDAATDAPCFEGWELGAVARGFLQESIESYARLVGKKEAIREARAFLKVLETAA